jgi:hypothetical protein
MMTACAAHPTPAPTGLTYSNPEQIIPAGCRLPLLPGCMTSGIPTRPHSDTRLPTDRSIFHRDRDSQMGFSRCNKDLGSVQVVTEPLWRGQNNVQTHALSARSEDRKRTRRGFPGLPADQAARTPARRWPLGDERSGLSRGNVAPRPTPRISARNQSDKAAVWGNRRLLASRQVTSRVGRKPDRPVVVGIAPTRGTGGCRRWSSASLEAGRLEGERACRPDSVRLSA